MAQPPEPRPSGLGRGRVISYNDPCGSSPSRWPASPCSSPGAAADFPTPPSPTAAHKPIYTGSGAGTRLGTGGVGAPAPRRWASSGAPCSSASTTTTDQADDDHHHEAGQVGGEVHFGDEHHDHDRPVLDECAGQRSGGRRRRQRRYGSGCRQHGGPCDDGRRCHRRVRRRRLQPRPARRSPSATWARTAG